jgi:hypothetical protein
VYVVFEEKIPQEQFIITAMAPLIVLDKERKKRHVVSQVEK